MTIVKREPLSLPALQDELLGYEREFNVRSADMRTAFLRNGHLEETAEFRRWSFIYGILKRHDALPA